MARKAAIYVRISTQSQHTDRQKEELIKLAENEGYDVVDTYTDILSGFKDEEHRPELKRLIEDCKLQKFNLVLFSEFSRLSRKVGDLNKMIDTFRGNNTELYFQKQNQWVKKKGDLGTNILIQVLGVVSEYEIDLFKERSISGKISAVKNRGINIGGLTAYGYKSEEGTKKLIIDTDEEPIVRRIFDLYAGGKTAQYICDLLNSDGISSPYNKRIAESKNRRKEKGIQEKEYKSLNPDKLVWIASTLTKILKNPLYIGKRSIKIRIPNSLDNNINSKENFELIEIEDNESIRIIDDNLFQQVQLKLKENSLVKDTAVKHPTLLKSVLKCGCCGRNVVSTKANGSYRYMCFGKIKDTKTRVINCTDSLEIAQYKLDGLVVQLIITRLADSERTKQSTIRIEELSLQKKEQEKILFSKETELSNKTESWLRYYDNSTEFNIPINSIRDKKSEYDSVANKLNQEINKLKNDITGIERTIRSIQIMVNSETQRQQQATIKENKELLKQLTDEYLEKVTIYPIFDKYSLVIISFKDGSETWGTIKSAKYKNEETWFDPTYCKVPHYIYQYWNNDDKSAEYNHYDKTVLYKSKTITTWNSLEPKESKPKFETIPREGQNPIIRMIKTEADTNDSSSLQITIPDPYITIESGTYPIKEFISLLKEDNAKGHNNNGDFPPYDFHEDEEGHEDSKEKAKQYRLDNADKRNARTKELRRTRKMESE
ncbi:MAG: recombinase family protein [Paludibacter sp.]|nr:recombinase family protein [Paludibacter sp.]